MHCINIFLQRLQIPEKVCLTEKKRALTLSYMIFLEKENMENKLTTHRDYRSTCRKVYGVWISRQRPRKIVKNIELQVELF